MAPPPVLHNLGSLAQNGLKAGGAKALPAVFMIVPAPAPPGAKISNRNAVGAMKRFMRSSPDGQEYPQPGVEI
ncbi:hypothetical protein EKH55_2054 [Sinorhizobium alkalisoli]|nr:hypothetical protein EKH55_2054 [Sinorhizobium alkalisoli]